MKDAIVRCIFVTIRYYVLHMASVEEIRAERLKKLELLKERGMHAYPARTKRDRSIADFLRDFTALEKSEEEATLAGRVMTLRRHGALMFADLFDGTARIQIIIRKDDVGEDTFSFFADVVDSGDFIEVTGASTTSKTGQQSILMREWHMLSKSLRALPDEWYGIKDEDETFRKRYLDILLNEDVAEMFKKKSRFWNTIRTFLLERDFIEVDTPVLENTTGGAEARPFVTHHNALDMDVYLRISAGELWQKRLMVAGMPKVFEIGRIFRNEGMSREHLQDYTQVEFYQAYMDYRTGMEMVRELYTKIATEVFGTTKFTIGEHEVDFAGEWQTYDFCALLQKQFALDPLTASIEDVKNALEKNGIEYDPNTLNLERGIDTLWKSIRKTLAGPGFLVNVPVYLEPLAKRAESDERTVERFQVVLAGSEVGKGFSELNDPLDQHERFAKQQALRDAGDDEAQMADAEFVEALEYGMPPTFGFGVSERLFAFLANKPIREAQLFPLMRPRDEQ